MKNAKPAREHIEAQLNLLHLVERVDVVGRVAHDLLKGEPVNHCETNLRAEVSRLVLCVFLIVFHDE